MLVVTYYGPKAWHIYRVDHNDGQILSTMEWSMVFVKVPLQLMVFQWFLHNWTIAIEWMVLRLTIVIDGMVNGF